MNFVNILTAFCFLTIVSIESAKSNKKYFRMETLNPLQALRFERIGSLKIIYETRTITFNYNLKSLVEDAGKEFHEKLKAMESLCGENDDNCVEDHQRLVQKLKEINDQTIDFVNPKPSRRKRDLFGFMTQFDGQTIQNDLRNLHEKSVEVLKVIQEHHQKLESIILHLKKTSEWLDETARNNSLEFRNIKAILTNRDTQRQLIEFSEILNSIFRLMINKRMDYGLIKNTEFQSQLDQIKTQLNGTNRTLPFGSVREYLNNVEALYTIVDKTLIIEMKIPIIEDKAWSLSKIQKLPAKSEDKLIMIDAQWSYLANDSSHIVYFISLDLCFKTDQNTFLCEIQSSMIAIATGDDCVTKAFKNLKIDMEVCAPEIRGIQFSHLTFVRYSDGQYFYFTNEHDILHIICHGTEEEVTLPSKIGMIYLEPGCVVITKRVRILVTGRSQETPAYWIHDIMNITFDLETFKKSIEKINTPPVEFTHIHENVQHLMKAMSLTTSPDDIKYKDVGFFAGTLSWREICLIIAIIVVLLIVILLSVLSYKNRKYKNMSSKS